MKTGVIYCPNHWGFKSQKKKHDEIIDALDKYLPGYDFVQSESADSVERLVNTCTKLRSAPACGRSTH